MASVFRDLTSEKIEDGLPEFRFSSTLDKVVIQFATSPKSFAVLADILDKVDEFNLAFSSRIESEEKALNKADESFPLPVPLAEENEKMPEQEARKGNNTKPKAKKVANTSVQNGAFEELREYILTLSNFSLK